ncbi:hypothetical protein JAAARDRAFT_173465 [Jaapia argillacea MUCL 33604]|uniref:Vacuolar import and degradation protein n=1 Tax=Jaapia argillacea MUCL 33604 TaxID=933084 RepID=A0A067Q4E0_9AGAM|nr:hypothetical protein JAAARDRAFT_173465 [Jaapia argillacea MUCL 33604]
MESSESSSSCSDSDVPYRRPQSLSLTPPLPSHTTKRSRLTCDTSAPSTSLQPTQRPSTYIKQQAREIRSPFSHDPLVDITRLRVRSQGCHCLYPGAVFQGTQKSGRNSYDVTVNIVDVDFSSSSLCGYLCIRGLTDDWPELTTYFDAEIIGSRYGFRTQDWSATEQDDLSHWSCFPAFKHVKPELQKPSWTVPDRDRGAVFMRWKERFLVPDHRVQDISGASFAGFYYVCVDFNPQAHQSPLRTVSEQLPLSSGEDAGSCPAKTEPPIRPQRRESRDFDRSTSARRSSSRSWSPSRPTTATMSGYYFHQNSEPYQQLSLSHVAQHTASSFEFR